jgi:hypothetical protein
MMTPPRYLARVLLIPHHFQQLPPAALLGFVVVQSNKFFITWYASLVRRLLTLVLPAPASPSFLVLLPVGGVV